MSNATDKQTRLTPAQAVKVYGHSRKFWMALIKSGELRASDERFPGAAKPRWKIDPVDVEAWREGRKARPQHELPELAMPVRRPKGLIARRREARQRKRAAELVSGM